MKPGPMSLKTWWVPSAKSKNGWYPYRVLINKINILELIGRWDEAEALLRDAVVIFDGGPDLPKLAESKNALGNILTKKGRLKEALDFYRDACQAYSGQNDIEGVTLTGGNIGMTLWMLGEREEALKYFDRALEIARTSGNAWNISGAMGNMGNACAMQGKLDEAKKYYLEMIKLAEQLGDKLDLVTGMVNLGNVYFYQEDHISARNCYERMVTITREIGNTQGLLTALGNLGLIQMKAGDYQGALKYFDDKLALARKIGYPQGEMTAYYNIAEMFLQTGKYQRAYEYYSLQYDAAVKIGDGLYQYRALTNMGLAQHLQDKDQEAKELLLKAGDRGRKSAPPDEMCLTYYFLGEVYLNLAQFHEALVAADEALKAATLAGRDDDADKARLLKLRIRHRNGDRQALDEIIAISSNSGDISVLADVHYCLFKITGKNEYREKALTALKKLCRDAPDHFNQTRIDELETP